MGSLLAFFATELVHFSVIVLQGQSPTRSHLLHFYLTQEFRTETFKPKALECDLDKND